MRFISQLGPHERVDLCGLNLEINFISHFWFENFRYECRRYASPMFLCEASTRKAPWRGHSAVRAQISFFNSRSIPGSGLGWGCMWASVAQALLPVQAFLEIAAPRTAKSGCATAELARCLIPS